MTRTLLASLLLLTGCFEEETEGSGDAGDLIDPTADDDGDGFTNFEEEAAGTNPNYEYSRPYEGDYNVGFCDSPPVATGPRGTGEYVDPSTGDVYNWPALVEGDVPDNFTLQDQHGEMVDLYSFCGKHVMLVTSAGWCGPCKGLAAEVQAIQDEHREAGLQIIEVITQDSGGNPPGIDFLEYWASTYEFADVPVLGAPEPTSYDHPTFWFDLDAGIPSVYHLNANLEVVSADQMVHDPSNWL